MKFLLERATFLLSPAVVLALLFSSLYLALGPGCFFSVDEVLVQETAQAVFLRGNLDVPEMLTVQKGLGDNYYAHRGPALVYTAVPAVALGVFLDDHFGSMRGSSAAGPPLGLAEHPLRWGGRLAIFTALAVNALLGGITVAALYLIALRFGLSQRAALLGAIAAGSSTLLVSESVHFFQHLLAALGLLLGFWILSDKDPAALRQRAFFGPLSLGIAVLARPDTAPPAAVLWLYGALVAWQSAAGASDLRKRLIRPALAALAGPLACVAVMLWYNGVQFGSLAEFGYSRGVEMGYFSLSLGHLLEGAAAYLVSPTLSVFLFSPLLILAVPASKRALRLWPAESRALLAAAASHLLLISLWMSRGGISYGPRFLLPSVLLVLPLMFPAIGCFLYAAPPARRRTVAALIGLGILVQLLGLAVYVTTSQWYRSQQGIIEGDAWVFVPAASPVWLHLKDLLAGRNLIPWALRVWSEPGPGLVFWLLLLVPILAGGRWLVRRFREWSASPEADGSSAASLSGGLRFAQVVIGAIALLILIGLARTEPIRESQGERIFHLIHAGMEAQEAGREVIAQEYYALVLGMDPGNKFALYNLGLLHENAGQTNQARVLYQRALQTDPSFAPAATRLAGLDQTTGPTAAQAPTAPEDPCPTPADCFQSGKRLWDAGDKPGALAVWLKGAEKFPKEVYFIRNVALCRYELGDYEGAVRDYRTAASQMPGDLGVRVDLGWALLRAGRLDEARQTCNEVLAADPRNTNARAILAQIPQ